MLLENFAFIKLKAKTISLAGLQVLAFSSLVFLISCASGDHDDIKNDSIKVTKDDGSSTELVLAEVSDDCLSGNVSQGLQKLATTYAKYKTSTYYWNLVGVCFLVDEKPLKARLFFLRALDENKDNFAALSNLGIVHWKLHKYQEGLFYLKKAYDVNQESDFVNFNLGRMFIWYGDNEKSQFHFNKINNKKFLNDYALHYQAANDVVLKNYSEAIQKFNDSETLWKSHDPKFSKLFAIALKNTNNAPLSKETWSNSADSSNELNWLWAPEGSL